MNTEARVRVKVVPGARRSEVVGPLGDRLKVRISAPAEGGKANRDLIALLREWLEAREVEIVAGHGAAEKVVRVSGMSAAGAQKLRRMVGEMK